MADTILEIMWKTHQSCKLGAQRLSVNQDKNSVHGAQMPQPGALCIIQCQEWWSREIMQTT